MPFETERGQQIMDEFQELVRQMQDEERDCWCCAMRTRNGGWRQTKIVAVFRNAPGCVDRRGRGLDRPA